MNKNGKIIIDGKNYTPLTGVKRIIYGIKYEVENPITFEKEWAGDGHILYDITYPKNRPYFGLILKTKKEE